MTTQVRTAVQNADSRIVHSCSCCAETGSTPMMLITTPVE
jgi:hypothetical protein